MRIAQTFYEKAGVHSCKPGLHFFPTQTLTFVVAAISYNVCVFLTQQNFNITAAV